MSSIWMKDVELPQFAALKRDRKTDVLIIGGGLAGILCAFLLTQSGVDCVLVEQNSICGGVTKNTTAKITSQHGLIYHKLIREFGVEKARMYLQANEDAIKKYRELCGNIPCEFEEKSAFVYTRSHEKKIQQEKEALNQIGFSARYVQELPLPFPIEAGIAFDHQAQFHPLKFVSGIVYGLQIYEHTTVQEWLGNHTVLTNHGKITAQATIVATHFPFLNKHGSYFLKMYQQRSYVLALAHAQNVQGMYIDEEKNGLSFRNDGDLLLLGGGGHRTGKQGGNWRELMDFAAEKYPEAQEICRWAAQDCMTLDGVPYIGQYSKNTPGFYVATGFNKWGMTSSMVAAMLLTDLVTGKENPYAEVFAPSRTILRPQLAVNAWEATVHLLTPSRKRCPHLGCALKWNAAEHSWDCPCHGSRFAEDGKRINNPATGDLKK